LSKAAFDKIAGGLMEVVAIIQSEADRALIGSTSLSAWLGARSASGRHQGLTSPTTKQGRPEARSVWQKAKAVAPEAKPCKVVR
jgi:hypothetical protein